MRPIKLVMSAFGSYADEEIIEFDKAGRGLFLITGDTGAGKTTIFDAIMYALYDETSGRNRSGNMMRSQYAKPDTPTFVRFSFEYGKKEYCITRNPEYERESKRKNAQGEPKSTIEKSSVSLIMPDGSEFMGKKAEINAKIVEIIGLNANQFVQVAMIAQGDFMRLLYADSSDRREIFSRIFRTESYRQMQQELQARSRKICEALEDNRKLYIARLEDVRVSAQISEGMTEELEELKKKNEPDCENAETLVLKIAQEQEKQLIVQQNNQKELQKKTDDNNSELLRAAENNRKLELLEEAQKEADELNAQEESVNLSKERLNLAKRASAVNVAEERLNDAGKNLEISSKRHESILEWIQKASEELKNEQEKLSKEQEIFDRESPAMKVRMAQIEESIPHYENYNNKCSELEAAKKAAGDLEKDLAELNKRLENAIKSQEALEKYQKQHMDCHIRQQQISDKTLQTQKLLDRTKALKVREEQLETLKKRVEEYAQEYQKRAAEYSEAHDEYERLERIFMSEQAGILAEQLEQGKPCPVCGSLSHPLPCKRQQADVTQAGVNAAKNTRDTKDAARQEAMEKSIAAGKEYESDKESLERDSKEILADGADTSLQIEKLGGQLGELNDAFGELSEIICAYDENEKKLGEIAEETDLLKADIEKKRGEADSAKIQCVSLNEQCSALKEGLEFENAKEAEEHLNGIKTNLHNMEQEYEESVKIVQNLQKELAGKQGEADNEKERKEHFLGEYRQREAEFYSLLADNGFETKQEYSDAKLEDGVMRQLSEDIGEYEKKCAVAGERLAVLRAQAKDIRRIEVSELENIKRELADMMKSVTAQCSDIYSDKRANEQVISQIKELGVQRNALRQEYEIYGTLYETSCGRLSGSVKMDFETYVLRQYFRKIINAANYRLAKMNGGQWRLKCRDISDMGNRGQAGLDLDIHDEITNSSRDVKTLSGGEAFMAALAMALGMADIIQSQAGVVRLDTMFIDEGFGSLDDYSRQQAIGILCELADGKRTIGIISHVTELKEQIDNQLVVSKSSRGSHAQWRI